MNTLSKLVKSTTPEYTTVLPISKKKVTFRPFKVKEEKVLLMAIEDGSENAILRSIINIIESCCDDIGDAGDLQTLDIEYIFIQLRSKSLGETVEPLITCPFTDEKKQEIVNAHNIGLDEKIEFLEDLMPDVFADIVKYFENTPKLGIKVKYKTSDGEEREITLSGLQDFFG